MDKDGIKIPLDDISNIIDSAARHPGIRLNIRLKSLTDEWAQSRDTILRNDAPEENDLHLGNLQDSARPDLSVPLRVGKKIIGVLDVETDDLESFSKEDIRTLDDLAGQIAAAIDDRLFEETSWRLRTMIALHKTSLDIISTLDREDVLQAITVRAAELLETQGAALWTYDAKEGIAKARALYNHHSKYEGAILEKGDGVIGQVVASGRPMIVNNYSEWDGRSESFADSPLTAMVAVPLFWHDEVIGCLEVLDENEKRTFSMRDQWALTALGDLTTVALENAQLHSKLKQINENLEELVSMRTIELVQAKREIDEKATQLQELLDYTIQMDENERAHLSRDLHDNATQLILGAVYATCAASDQIEADPSSAREDMEQVKKILHEIEKEIRHTIHNLHPPILEAKGIVPALRKYIRGLKEYRGMHCDLNIFGSEKRFSENVEIAVYRIVQEALHNAFNHSGSDRASILFRFEYNNSCVVVEDYGVGFDLASQHIQDSRGYGIIGMRERARAIGAKLRLESGPDKGTRVYLEIPH